MNKRKYSLLGIYMSLSIAVIAAPPKYFYKIDLTNVVDDKVFVELTLEDFSGDYLIFNMPKMIPGTYAIEDYGRFVSAFKALDKKGRELPVEQTGTNSWKISKAKKLVRITYWVEDSYDTTIEGPEIFQPAGTNIEVGKNFIINSSGFFGFFQGYTSSEYELNIIRPAEFYGSTGLIPESTNNELTANFSIEGAQVAPDAKVDVFKTPNYDELVDSPLMYSLPDTAVIDVGGTEVLVATYSPNKVVNSKEIASTIEEVLIAQKDYLGGELPVDKYAFIFYFTDQPIMSYGALEHSYSSFYYMPEYTLEQMNQQLRDFAAHEFFHIVTPLTIHSEQIQPFNFIEPEMSRHLWLYEGMTEYFAGNAQVKAGLISVDQYISMIRQKMMTAAEFNDSLPITQLSLGALDEYADQYYNVYQKGALIGLALDLTLLDLSDGQYGVQQMMADLSKEYGKHKSFNDDMLFDKITAMTYPEVRQFFSTYVEGSTPLNYAEFFTKAGLIYEPTGVYYDYSFGLTQQNLGVDMENGVFFVQNIDKLDPFGKELGFLDGDILVGFNGSEMPPLGPAIMQYFQETIMSMEEGREFTVTVKRIVDSDEPEEVLLSAPTTKVERVLPFAIRPDEQVTEKQMRVRLAWLGLD